MTQPSGEFCLAPMSGLIRVLTGALLVLPLVFVFSGGFAGSPLRAPGVLLVFLYLWTWLRFRPGRFVVHADGIDVIWPLKRRRISRASIEDVRRIDRAALRAMAGRGLRVGVGGLWGGFGWLWTERRGIVQMYVSRADGLVWIERGAERPWLITPESPEAFVRAVTGAAVSAPRP